MLPLELFDTYGSYSLGCPPSESEIVTARIIATITCFVDNKWYYDTFYLQLLTMFESFKRTKLNGSYNHRIAYTYQV